MANQDRRAGITLLEVLLTMSILTIMAMGGIAVFDGYTEETTLNSVADTIIFDLKRTQARAMAGESNRRWGIHFVNGTNDYYEVFSTPTDYSHPTVATDTTQGLYNSITFVVPTSTTDIVFKKTLGTPLASSTIALRSPNGTIRVINVNTAGGIY